MHTMQQTHAQVCTSAYISKKIPELPQKKLQVNSTRACSTYVAVASLPSHRWVLPSGKICTPKFSCKFFPYTLAESVGAH